MRRGFRRLSQRVDDGRQRRKKRLFFCPSFRLFRFSFSFYFSLVFAFLFFCVSLILFRFDRVVFFFFLVSFRFVCFGLRFGRLSFRFWFQLFHSCL